MFPTMTCTQCFNVLYLYCRLFRFLLPAGSHFHSVCLHTATYSELLFLSRRWHIAKNGDVWSICPPARWSDSLGTTLWINCNTPSLELSHRPHPTIYPPPNSSRGFPILRVCGLYNQWHGQHPFWKSQIKVWRIGKIWTEWKLWRQGNMPVALGQIQCCEKMSSRSSLTDGME